MAERLHKSSVDHFIVSIVGYWRQHNHQYQVRIYPNLIRPNVLQLNDAHPSQLIIVPVV